MPDFFSLDIILLQGSMQTHNSCVFLYVLLVRWIEFMSKRSFFFDWGFLLFKVFFFENSRIIFFYFFYKQNYNKFFLFCEIKSTMKWIDDCVYTQILTSLNQNKFYLYTVVRTPKLNYNNQPANHNWSG